MNLFLKRRSTPPSGKTPVAATTTPFSTQAQHRRRYETDGTVRIDGRLEGSIRRAAVVILGAGA